MGTEQAARLRFNRWTLGSSERRAFGGDPNDNPGR
jgi:hypothetical protein